MTANQGFPWQCVVCAKTFRGTEKIAHRIDFSNRVCFDCWQKAKEDAAEALSGSGLSNKTDFEWESHGYKCEARISETGIPCGYVGLPKTHPYYGKNYDDIDDIEVHGGLTYSEPAFWRKDDLWYLGFDCGHFYDIGSDAAKQYLGLYSGSKALGGLMELADEIMQDKIPETGKTKGPKDLDYVKAECERLAEQLAKVAKK